MSHPLLVMPLPFRTVRSLRRRSKDNTGLNLQGPDVNRESREQISGQHRGVRRSPWMPPFPLPAQNRVESGKIGFLRVESGIIGSGSSTRPPKSGSKGSWSPRALLGHKRPFYIKESWGNLAGVSELDSGLAWLFGLAGRLGPPKWGREWENRLFKGREWDYRLWALSASLGAPPK